MNEASDGTTTIESGSISRSRRDFVKGVVSTTALAGIAGPAPLAKGQQQASSDQRTRPNVVLYVADQMRWDFIGAYGLNPTTKTPNLNRIVERGVAFTGAVTNQPLCSPSRACMITGRYATETGMWKLPPPNELRRDLPTLATVLRENGYTANFIGKWHLWRRR